MNIKSKWRRWLEKRRRTRVINKLAEQMLDEYNKQSALHHRGRCVPTQIKKKVD